MRAIRSSVQFKRGKARLLSVILREHVSRNTPLFQRAYSRAYFERGRRGDEEKGTHFSFAAPRSARARAYFLYSLPFSIFAMWFASLNAIKQRCHRDTYIRDIHRLTFSSYRDSIDGGTTETIVECVPPCEMSIATPIFDSFVVSEIPSGHINCIYNYNIII